MVVIGNGIAGSTAALTLRAEGYRGSIVLIGQEPDAPYRRPPLSKGFLRGEMAAQSLRLYTSDTWTRLDIKLLTSTTVAAIDTRRRTVDLGTRAPLPYDRLLLATGAYPRPWPSAHRLAGVHTLRTLGQARALSRQLTPGARLLVIGAGMIGLEVAACARVRDCQVTVIEAAPHPLAHLLPAEVSAPLTALHRARGVGLHTFVHLQDLSAGDNGVLTATDRSGRSWEADVVVVATGTRANAELAGEAGLAVDDGIVVDRYCATSEPGIFAAGDVTSQPDALLGGHRRIEQWANAQEHGVVAALNMLGKPMAHVPLPWCWTDQFGTKVQICGWPLAADRTRLSGDVDARDFTATFHREGLLIGAVCFNRPAQFRDLRHQITLTLPAVDGDGPG